MSLERTRFMAMEFCIRNNIKDKNIEGDLHTMLKNFERRLAKEVDELKEVIFVKHVELHDEVKNHPDPQAYCKICNKSITQIYDEWKEHKFDNLKEIILT